jgi:hypothetical protein
MAQAIAHTKPSRLTSPCVFVKSRRFPRDTHIVFGIPSRRIAPCGRANRAPFCAARASEHPSHRTALRAVDEIKAGTTRVRFEAGLERRSNCHRASAGYTAGTRKNRTDYLMAMQKVMLAGAVGLEPTPSSLTVRCPTNWTTPHLCELQ